MVYLDLENVKNLIEHLSMLCCGDRNSSEFMPLGSESRENWSHFYRIRAGSKDGSNFDHDCSGKKKAQSYQKGRTRDPNIKRVGLRVFPVLKIKESALPDIPLQARF